MFKTDNTFTWHHNFMKNGFSKSLIKQLNLIDCATLHL